MYNALQYKYRNDNFIFDDVTNLEAYENKKANTGHANANVYVIGPQYEYDIPVKHRNKSSTNLSTTIYIVNKVKIYVANVFLSVFK